MKVINTLVDRFFGPAVDTKIAQCLVGMAEIGRDAARILKNSECRNLDAIAQFERSSDALVEQIHVHIDEAFQLRFFDKRDIEHLSKELDDVINGMRRAAKHVAWRGRYLANAELPVEAKRLLEIICEVTEIVQTLITQLENRHLPLEKVSSLVDTLDTMESEADRLLSTVEDALDEKYAPNGNVFEYMAWEKFYRLLEKITDSANHVGNLVLSIARK